MSVDLILLGCLLEMCMLLYVWLVCMCCSCYSLACVNIGVVAFSGFIFGLLALSFIFTQIPMSLMDPILRICMICFLVVQTIGCMVVQTIGCLVVQTIGCLVGFMICAVGYQVSEWVFDKMEVFLPRIQNRLIRFIEQNWNQLLSFRYSCSSMSRYSIMRVLLQMCIKFYRLFSMSAAWYREWSFDFGALCFCVK